MAGAHPVDHFAHLLRKVREGTNCPFVQHCTAAYSHALRPAGRSPCQPLLHIVLVFLFFFLLLVAFYSMATGLYVVIQLFKIAPTDPLYYALLRPVHAKYASVPGPRASYLPADSSSFSQWLP